MCGSKSSGPSAAELQAAADASAARERERLKGEQEIERARVDNQMAFERETAANNLNALKTQTELQAKCYQDQLVREEAKETERLLTEEKQTQLKAAQELEAARNQGELNSQQLAQDQARRKTYVESFYYLDDDNVYDDANAATSTRRKNAAKAS